MEIPDLSHATHAEKLRIKELLERRLLSGSFLEFAEAVEPSFVVYPHVRFLAEQLERIADGSIDKLAISMPPRHSKSFLSSYLFPLWYLWCNPDKTIMLCSYSSSPAERFSRTLRDKIVGTDLLSEMKLNAKAVSKDMWELDSGGGLIAAGVNGALTGMGCDLLIIDDPVKDSAEAMSPTYRKKTYEWYQSTATTRLEPGGAQILIQTRWHDADLMGQVLDAQGDEWTVVTLPALALEDDPMGREVGGALCPERYDEFELKKKRSEVGEYVFSALYQQDPTPEGGSMFKRSDARFFEWVDADNLRLEDRIVSGDSLTLFLSADLAASIGANSDYSVIGVFAFSEQGDTVLLEMRRGKWKPSRVASEIRRAYVEWGCKWATVEKGPVSLSVLEELSDIVVKPVAPTSNKVARALPAQLEMERGKVWFPKDALWLREFEDELYRFPTGKHDDQVDVLAWAVDTVKTVGWGRGELVDSHLKGDGVRYDALGLGDDIWLSYR